jgi:deazaflavin-dependent oxidoreductase (nitroreductase family)
MMVEIPPKGTYGAKMPKLPRPVAAVFWKLFSMGARLRGARLLELTTVGARTGRDHTIPLAWFPDSSTGENAWLIVASWGGSARHPDWYFNLARNPNKVWIRIGNRKWHVQPESLKGTEREVTFQRIAQASPGYATYQKKTDRLIPVVRLRPATETKNKRPDPT